MTDQRILGTSGLVVWLLFACFLPCALRAQEAPAPSAQLLTAPPAPVVEAPPASAIAAPPAPAASVPAEPPPAAHSLPPAAGAPQPAAEPAPRATEPFPPLLPSVALACPTCACEQARSDVATLKDEYRDVHHKVSTRRPRRWMMLGFVGAGVMTVWTALAYTQPWSDDPEFVHDKDRKKRVLLQGTIAISIPLSVGLIGMNWYRRRRAEAAPYMERYHELRVALPEARRSAREQCLAVSR
jgi:hypothetical protein